MYTLIKLMADDYTKASAQNHSLMVEHLPNMGIPPGSIRPIDIDHLFPEKNTDLMVELIISAATSGKPRDYHWMLAWELGRVEAQTSVHRCVNIVREVNANHLTNWGAMTKTVTFIDPMTGNRVNHSIELKVMTRAQRTELEAIGNATPVRKPDGTWNCQDWVISVLESAEAAGLIARGDWVRAVKAAHSL